ncbi:hypothetical protein ABMA27_001140 [Loxostege sticticalis]|uniref:Putative nuclease HARBI1 n=1 Tax=Loxostege sticticalis TaxID=481309 RepID=A0ABR3I1M1_LOXSC
MNLNIIRHFEDSESSSDDDDIIVEYVLNRRPKTFRDRILQLEFWDDVDFFERYRMSKTTVLWLHNELKNSLKRPTDRNHAVSPLDQILLTLRFYATGNIQQCSGDLFGLHKSTICRIIHHLSRVICCKLRSVIKMPQNVEEIRSTIAKFYNIAKFPSVIGAIDCTHIPILNPGGNNSELYRNRKDFFSINTQVIADAELRILDLVARWPGSVHDSTIFNASEVKRKFDRGDFGNCCLLGDRGYALKKYLMTPLIDPQSQPERLYNESQIRTRNVVERTFGVWKRRFPAIGSKLRVDIKNIQPIIVATAILHNICINHKENIPQETMNYPDIDMPIAEISTQRQSEQIYRNQLIQEYFARLSNETTE